jgi:hypothetical protein
MENILSQFELPKNTWGNSKQSVDIVQLSYQWQLENNI